MNTRRTYQFHGRQTDPLLQTGPSLPAEQDAPRCSRRPRELAPNIPQEPLVEVRASGRLKIRKALPDWPLETLPEGLNLEDDSPLGLDDLKSEMRLGHQVEVFIEGVRVQLEDCLAPALRIRRVEKPRSRARGLIGESQAGESQAGAGVSTQDRYVRVHDHGKTTERGEKRFPQFSPRGAEKADETTIWPNPFAARHSRIFSGKRDSHAACYSET